MNEQLWIATLTTEQLEAWLAPPRTSAPFAILERLTDIDFPATDEPIVPANWEQGRIFGPTFELRWERQGDAYRVWLTGENEAPEFTQELSSTRRPK